MPTRRDFVKTTVASCVFVGTPLRSWSSERARAGSGVTKSVARDTGAHVTALSRREDTVLRYPSVGDNWHMTWAADNRQYASQCDGFGLEERPRGLYNSRMIAIEGESKLARFHDLPGYPELMPSFDRPRYYNFGTLALDGTLYQYLSTMNATLDFYHPKPNGLRFVGAKLIYSPDNGRTWRNQNGSSPVTWEGWDRRSRDTMVFFEEDQEAFSLLTILQMGRNYEHNRDGFIYVYGPNGNTEGTMNELVMFRAPKTQLLNRSAYQYFAGIQQSGAARWSKDIAARRPVHTFPRGWVNTLVHPFAWHPSVVYNAPLGLYMMANWATGVALSGEWFAKPSYLGFWVAPNPWGPWAQVHEDTAWMPALDSGARAFAPQIAPKWIAADGRSFWLVWSDYQLKDEKEHERYFTDEVKDKYYRMEMSPDEWAEFAVRMRRHRPFYAFNVQRVDLILG